MSCLIVSEEKISTLSNFIADILNKEYPYCGFSVPKNLPEAFSDCRDSNMDYNFNAELIYNKLYKLNIVAYNTCYETYEYKFSFPEYKAIKINTQCKQNSDHWIIEEWHYRILKNLDCYLYQCEEFFLPEYKIFVALKDLQLKLMRFIISNTDEYYKLSWL